MQIVSDLEVGYVPLSRLGAYPKIYLSTSPARFVRIVRNISHTKDEEKEELIGPFEHASVDFLLHHIID